MTACQHQNYEPVESVVTGERLAMICSDCLDELPLTYSGKVIEIRDLCSVEPAAYIPQP